MKRLALLLTILLSGLLSGCCSPSQPILIDYPGVAQRAERQKTMAQESAKFKEWLKTYPTIKIGGDKKVGAKDGSVRLKRGPEK